MKRTLSFLTVIILLTLSARSFANDRAKSYIEKYKEVAILEMHRTGIPASIKLAQALLESNWGQSDLATKANNHFGIKCGGNWNGKTYYKQDDDFDTDGQLLESCFRVFRSPLESFQNHSDFLTDPKKSSRYGFLFQFPTTDFVSWANGLHLAGYATDNKYPKKLIEIIEKYKLHELDQPINEKTLAQIKDRKENQETNTNKILNINKTVSANARINYDIKTAKVEKDLSAHLLAEKYNIPIRNFITFNEIILLPDDVITAGTTIFLENKKRDYQGEETTYTLREGESIEYVSHIYGVRARTLRSINKIKKGETPKPNSNIKLKK
jgi:Mannosyl-glycoprotein endo-beta-N-acetylglucosaminidase/LysM domain